MTSLLARILFVWLLMNVMHHHMVTGVHGGEKRGSQKDDNEKSGNRVIVDPAIYQELAGKTPGTKLSVIVTFKNKPDLLKDASDGHFLLAYFQREFLPNLEAVKLGNRKFAAWLRKSKAFFLKAQRNDVNVKSFKKSYLGHVVKGFYVYNTMKQASAFVEEVTTNYLSRFSNWKLVKKYVVANSALLEADLEVIEYLRDSGFVTEIFWNKPFAVKGIQSLTRVASPSSPRHTGLQMEDVTDLESALQQEDDGKEATERSLLKKFHLRKPHLGPNGGAGAAGTTNTPQLHEWNIEWIGAHEVYNVTRGEGLLFASADTGVEWQHPILYPNYAGLKYSQQNIQATTGYMYGQDQPPPQGTAEERLLEPWQVRHDYAWWDGVKGALSSTIGPCGIDAKAPCDDSGHGTHTTSTAVGLGGFGVAPGAAWMACRNMDQGVGSTATYLNCLEFFLAPTDLTGKHADPSRRPHVIGNSYGCPDSEGCAKLAFHAAVSTLRQAGIFMSVSAGNEGPGCASILSPPAYEPDVFTVGASQFKSDAIAGFSSRGPIRIPGIDRGLVKPDVVAPGVRIRAAYLNNSYAALSGTSMASPHVSGMALLLSAACPHIMRRIDLLERCIIQSCRPLSSRLHGGQLCGSDTLDTVPNLIYGHGMVQVPQAYALCKALLTDVSTHQVNLY